MKKRLLCLSCLFAIGAIGAIGCVPLAITGGATAVAVAHDRRSAGTVIDDQTLGIEACSRARQVAGFSPEGHINCESYNYAVLLTGEVPSQEVGQAIIRTVESLTKTRKVYNYLVVAPASTLGNRSNDALITTKAKAALVQHRLDPTLASVTTERAVVYLFGFVTQEEANIAVQAIDTVGGIQTIVKLFEYVPAPMTNTSPSSSTFVN